MIGITGIVADDFNWIVQINDKKSGYAEIYVLPVYPLARPCFVSDQDRHTGLPDDSSYLAHQFISNTVAGTMINTIGKKLLTQHLQREAAVHFDAQSKNFLIKIKFRIMNRSVLLIPDAQCEITTL